MKKNKIILKMVASLLVMSAVSTTAILPASATEINSTNPTTFEEQYNLKTVDSVPSDAKILKFANTEQAEKYIKLVEENKNCILDLSSLLSENELSGQIVDLSNKEISSDNFKSIQEMINEDASSNLEKKQIPSKGMHLKDYNTTLKHSFRLGFGSVNLKCSVKVKWSSAYGNYISSVNSVNSSLSGYNIGTSWSQYSYDANISDDGQSVDVTVYATVAHYILVESSMTQVYSTDESASCTLYL